MTASTSREARSCPANGSSFHTELNANPAVLTATPPKTNFKENVGIVFRSKMAAAKPTSRTSRETALNADTKIAIVRASKTSHVYAILSNGRVSGAEKSAAEANSKNYQKILRSLLNAIIFCRGRGRFSSAVSSLKMGLAPNGCRATVRAEPALTKPF